MRKNPRTLRVWKLCAPEPQKVFNKFGWCCCRTDDGLARIPLYRKMDDFQFLQPAVTLVQISFTVDFFSAFTCVRSAMHITLCKRTAWITVSMRCSFFVKHCIFTYWYFYFIRFHTYTFSELTTNNDKYKKNLNSEDFFENDHRLFPSCRYNFSRVFNNCKQICNALEMFKFDLNQ